MQIRRNTKAFKSILYLLKECYSRSNRRSLVRFFITKAGQSADDRISIDSLENDADVFYDMSYDTVMSNMESNTRQLHSSDETPGLLFFRSSVSKTWDETPFEFDEQLIKEFPSLDGGPVGRKKEKSTKISLRAHLPARKDADVPTKVVKKEVGRLKKVAVKAHQQKDKPRQPEFRLKNEIVFSDLQRLVFHQPKITKQNVLSYYANVSEFVLPHVSGKLRFIRNAQGKQVKIHDVLSRQDNLPQWVKSVKVSADENVVAIRDKSDLLILVELGGVELDPGLSTIRTPGNPDQLVIMIDSPSYDLDKTRVVAIAAQQVLQGLKTPSFIKTDGRSGLHIHLPLDAKSDFEEARNVSGFICKLISLKLPGIVALDGAEEYTHGKVMLSHSCNASGTGVIAPYSFASGDNGVIATPLEWDEINDHLSNIDFGPEAVLSRVRRGDPFANFFRKKISASVLLKHLEEFYSFLL